MNELETLPRNMKVPSRPAKRGGHAISNIVLICKSDFDYMREREFRGRFTILNKRNGSGITHSVRLANALNGDDKTIVLSVATERRTTKSPDGATWRTVRLVSAYKTDDNKLCVIEITTEKDGDKA